MMKKIIILSVVLSLLGCESDVPTTQEFPIIQTLIPEDNDDTGATFKANVLQVGSKETTAYGFVWSLNDPIEAAGTKKVVLGENLQGDSFETRLSYSARRGLIYKIRAFADFDEKTVYGNLISIESESQKGSPWTLLLSDQDINESSRPYGLSSASMGGVLFQDSSYFRYDASNNSFTQGPDFPESINIDDQFYSSIGSSPLFVMSSASRNVYQLQNQNWVKITELPFDLISTRYYQVFTTDAKLYVLGSFNAYYFDLSSRTWQSVSSNPGGQLDPIVSGVSFEERTILLTEGGKILEYFPARDEWETLRSFPGISKDRVISFAYEERFYFGMSHAQERNATNFGFETKLYAYDPLSGFWIDNSTPPRTLGLDAFFYFFQGDKLYLGERAGGRYKLWSFDPSL